MIKILSIAIAISVARSQMEQSEKLIFILSTQRFSFIVIYFIPRIDVNAILNSAQQLSASS